MASANAKSVVDRMRETRRAAREKMAENASEQASEESDDDERRIGYSGIPEDTITAAMELTGSDLSDPEKRLHAYQRKMAEEVRDAENTMGDLKKRRKKKKREMAAALRGEDEDVKAELRAAKKTSKDKLRETQRLKEELSRKKAEQAGSAADLKDDTITAEAERGAQAGLGSRRASRDVELGEPTAPKVSTPRKEGADTVDLVTEDGGVPAEDEPKKKKGMSIRDKMRLKMEQKKEQALSEARKEELPKARKLKGLREQKSTRFDEPISEEKVEAATKKWKKASKFADEMTLDQAIEKSGVITEEDAYNFFAGNWDLEEEEEEKKAFEEAEKAKDAGEQPSADPDAGPSKKEEEKAGEDEKDKDEGEDKDEDKDDKDKDETDKDKDETDKDKDKEKDKKKKKKEKDVPEDKKKLLGDVPEDDMDDTGDAWVTIGRADYTPEKQKVEKEQGVLYKPASDTIPPEKKIEQGEVRRLEDEGLYVGTRPMVSIRNKNRMEHRLLNEPDGLGKKWFGEDGEVLFLPDPLKELPNRPPFVEENVLVTEYQKAVVREFDSRFIDGRLDEMSNYQLDIDLNSISFTHHHLFSREHVYAQQLIELYETYRDRKKKNVVEYFKERLRALKEAIENLSESIDNLKRSDSNSKMINDQENRLKEYKMDKRSLRQLKDTEEEAERHNLQSILKTWKEIKAVREFTGFKNTPIKLIVKKEKVDQNVDTQAWNDEIDEEVRDIMEDQDEEFEKEMNLYNEKVEEQKKLTLEKNMAKRRIKERKKKKKKSTEEIEVDEQEENQALLDDEILAKEDIELPEKPERKDQNTIRQQVIEKAMSIRRRGGEPKIHPELSFAEGVTPKGAINRRGEVQRRDAVDRVRIFVRILFNNKEVSRTPEKVLSQDFKVSFTTILNIQIVQWPESIRLEIYEKIGFSSELLAEIYIPVPEASTTTENVRLEYVDFSCDHLVEHSHEGVGSRVLFKYDKEESYMLSLNTTGGFNCSACWGINSEGNPMVPPLTDKTGNSFSAVKHMDPVAAIGAAGMIDMEKLSKWISASKLDPNDPSNADLLYLMRPMGGDGIGIESKLQARDYFRLEQLQEEFDFATDEEIASKRRFKLINLRDREISGFREMKPIPLKEEEIPQEIFQEYERNQRETAKYKTMREARDLEGHRQQVAKYMQRKREEVLQRFRFLAHQKTFGDVIDEDPVPNFQTIVPKIVEWCQPRRPMKPKRKTRKKLVPAVQQGVDILVNVVRGKNIPIRSENITGGGDAANKPKRRDVDLVRPFVEVTFQQKVQQTTVVDGPNPSWNEDIRMEFKPPNGDFSPNNLTNVRDVIYINLFDEVIVDIGEDDRDRDRSIHRRIEKKWLGSMKIPFSTLYLNSKIDGTFKLNMPPILLGYEHDQKSSTIETATGGNIDTNSGRGNATYMTFYITIDPPLSHSEPIDEKFDSTEDTDLIKRCNEFEAAFPKLPVSTLVVDMKGRSVFVTRYFRAIKPPDELLEAGDGAPETAEACARFVSLIPFVSDSMAFQGVCDIWSTCGEFMRMLAGDEEEHAVLLCNYFLYLNKKAYLVLGTAIPEGSTAYVITDDGDNKFTIWNASTGESYNQTDAYCPLLSVGCMMNQENVWANIQEAQKPSDMSFRVSDSSCWCPFYTKHYANKGLASIQPETLDYIITEAKSVKSLEDRLEKIIREKISEWRPRNVTRWNRQCMQTFRTLLSDLEKTYKKNMHAEHFAKLESVLSNYKMSGFPINMPFTETDPIIDEVFATGVHENEAKNVEFAVAVHIHAYPNSVMSVWIYIASLVRKR